MEAFWDKGYEATSMADLTQAMGLSKSSLYDTFSGTYLANGGYDKARAETALELSEHGTRFLAFSDGITEQFNAEGDMFGVEGLIASFREHIELPLDEMVTRIVRDLTRFRGTAIVKDDQTLLALGFAGERP